MKQKLKPTEVLRRYRRIERKQSIAYLIFVLLVSTILLTSPSAESGIQTAALLAVALLGLGLSCFMIQRCPVCGTPLFRRLRFILPLECPGCHTNFANGHVPERTLHQVPNP